MADCCTIAQSCVYAYGAALGALLLSIASYIKAKGTEKKILERKK